MTPNDTSDLPVIEAAGEERRLGLVAPAQLPTYFPGVGEKFRVLSSQEIVDYLRDKPSAHNRRKVFDPSWILNQLKWGSCNGHSIASNLAKSRFMRGQPKVLLSGSDAYSQMNGGHDNGSALADGMKVVQANGIAPLALNPTDRVFDWQVSAEAKAARSRFKGFECVGISSEQELASFLILNGLAVVAVHVTDPFMNCDKNGLNLGGNGVGNHSVAVDDVRLRDGHLEFDMPNSWGPGWQQDGRTWLRWDRHLQTTVRYHGFYGLPTATDDPQDDNPPV